MGGARISLQPQHPLSRTAPEKSSVKETPMMRQFHAAKRQHPDALLFFRMGDFFELFFEDAKVAAKELGLSLTARDKEKKVPMAGVPAKAMESYLMRLVRAGHTVAICDQVQDPRDAVGIVDREIVRVVSPGTLVDDDSLAGDEPLFVLAASPCEDGLVGLAWADMTTGSFRCTSTKAERIGEELARIGPAELVLPDIHESDGSEAIHASLTLIKELCSRTEIPVCLRPAWSFDSISGARNLKEQLKTTTLESFGIEDKPVILAACGAILDFLRDHQKSSLEQIRDLYVHEPSRHLMMDGATLRTLEITRSQKDGGREGTLLSVLDRTATPMGARLLRQWLLEPLVERDPILKRQEAVSELHQNVDTRRSLQEAMDGFGDMERTTSKLASGRAMARDLVALGSALERVPGLISLLRTSSTTALSKLSEQLNPCTELCERIAKTLDEQAPLSLKDGGLIREGFSEDLDELRALAAGGKQFLADLQVRESERTGIPLKLGFNRVFGYYIEITHSHRDKVPEDYIRKQTLKNAERYITPELKEYEAKVLGAEEKAKDLEYDIFLKLRDRASSEMGDLLETAAAVAEVDTLASLAKVAVERQFIRPELVKTVEQETGRLEIKEGRHPVVEAANFGDPFVPNDTDLRSDSCLVVLTGPNMSGKSTWLRQTALIVLMAQMGSFVPAQSARIGLVDRIFTRLGTGDDISRGQSTFMVEMVETANILRNASRQSLLLLDEVGRGTSTFDGLAIAWSVCEHVHEKLGARCLFATHYHQLTDLAESLSCGRNLNVAVREYGDDIVFLHRIEEGGTDRSYGIHVARLAGIPAGVLDRARDVLLRLEKEEEGLSRRILADHTPAIPEPSTDTTQEAHLETTQHSLFDLLDESTDAELLEELQSLDMNSLPPIEAWRLVDRIRRALEH